MQTITLRLILQTRLQKNSDSRFQLGFQVSRDFLGACTRFVQSFWPLNFSFNPQTEPVIYTILSLLTAVGNSMSAVIVSQWRLPP